MSHNSPTYSLGRDGHQNIAVLGFAVNLSKPIFVGFADNARRVKKARQTQMYEPLLPLLLCIKSTKRDDEEVTQ
jgi:hypothetical protein